MGMDGFAGNGSDSSNGGNKERDGEAEEAVRVKEETEPVAGTSKETFNNAATEKVGSENEFQTSGE